MWVTANTDVTFPIPFMVEDDYVLPTSAVITIRDLDGAVIYPPSVLPTLETTHWFTLQANMVTIPAGRDFQTLLATVNYAAAGGMHQYKLPLHILPFVPITVGPAEVRRELGLPGTELPDTEIDVVFAYFRLKRARGAVIDTALRSGTVDALQVNRAIAIEAALQMLPSLRLRIGQKLKSEDQEFTRFASVDWAELEARLEAELESLVTEFTPGDTGSTGSSFAWAVPADPITGGN